MSARTDVAWELVENSADAARDAMRASTVSPEKTIEPEERTDQAPDEATDEVADVARVWITIVWNDPVNLMAYVVYVFQQLFGYSRRKATSLMLDVHQKGRAVVSSGSREQMEADVARLHAAGLWATLQRDD